MELGGDRGAVVKQAPYLQLSDRPFPISCHPQKWLPRMDSNHDKQIQNLLCYRYTTRQFEAHKHWLCG